jgi:hypothetical protein
MDTDRYVRLLIGTAEVDLSQHSLVPWGADANKHLFVIFRLDGGVAGAQYAYLDNFILTQNEP